MVLQSPDYHFLSFAHLHQTVPPQLGVTGKFASEYSNKHICQLFDAILKKINEGPKRNHFFGPQKWPKKKAKNGYGPSLFFLNCIK